MYVVMLSCMYECTSIESLVNNEPFQPYCLKSYEKYELLLSNEKKVKKLLKIKNDLIDQKNIV